MIETICYITDKKEIYTKNEEVVNDNYKLASLDDLLFHTSCTGEVIEGNVLLSDGVYRWDNVVDENSEDNEDDIFLGIEDYCTYIKIEDLGYRQT